MIGRAGDDALHTDAVVLRAKAFEQPVFNGVQWREIDMTALRRKNVRVAIDAQ